MRTCFAAAFAALAPVAFMSCGITTDPMPPVVVSIRLQPAVADLITGETRQLTATPLDGSGNALTGRAVSWVTIVPAVATVSQQGLVTAVGAGQATIVARADGATASAAITVIGRAASVEITPDQATLDLPTDQLRLSAKVRDANGTVLPGWALIWTSSDHSIVQVGSDGLALPIGVGTASVSATSDGRVAHAAITVIRLPVESVSVSPSPASLLSNSVLQLTTTVLGPSGKVLLGRPIVWSSSNPVVASVSQMGLVTSHTIGDATVTATAEGHAAQALLTVVALSFSSVAAGEAHTCSLSTIGAAYCWGDNSVGQLGSVSIETCGGGFYYYYDYPCTTAPAPVGGGATFVDLTVGGFHTCGLSLGRQAYCWGVGSSGELGQGLTSGSMLPVAVLGGLSFETLEAGPGITCGVTVLGVAYCWGRNEAGQLGDATLTNRTAPVAVAGGLSFLRLSSGQNHTCGITTGARLYCWGANNFGQLGDGSLTPRTGPIAVAGNLSVIAVDAGSAHICAITTTGAAHCWGNNQQGSLGDGTTFSSPFPVAVAGGTQWKAIAAGGASTCGIASDDKAYCWGDNASGQLGDGSLRPRTTPVPVSGGLTFGSLSAGGSHTCGLTTSGLLFCWGAGWSGQLGTGLLDVRTVPTKVLHQP